MYYKRIRELREDNDYKQQKLADYLGVARSSYASYESGARDIPTNHICSLALFYHVSADYILELSDIPAPAKK